jgi:serine/threonine-protein kinase
VKKCAGDPIPLEVVSAIVCDALHGLHAAHEATDESGEPLHMVHRDVSPQNLLVGADGHTRVLDFGVAKAAGRLHTTKDGRVKGKIAYMSPEQLRGEPLDRRADVYAAGIVLWELLTGERLFMAESEGETAVKALERAIDAPSKYAKNLSPELDALVLRALARDRTKRFSTARQMAIALEEAVKFASARRVGEWVQEVSGDVLRTRAKTIVELESLTGATDAAPAEQEQEKSSASVEVTPTRPKKSSPAKWIALGAVLIGGTALALSMAKEKPKQASAPDPVPVPVPVPVTASAAESKARTVQSAPDTTTEPMVSAKPSLPPSTTVKVSKPTVSVSAATSASAGPCPLRSYVDGEGILRFTRDCTR